MTAAQAVVEAFPDRQRAALVDAARGRGEGVQTVEVEAAKAQATVRAATMRIAALRAAEAEIQDEQQAIFDSDAGLRHFRAKAEQASRDAEAARVAAEAACSALQQAWMSAYSQWGGIRQAMKRRDEEEAAPREMPMPEFPGAIGTMSRHWGPWPGGSRAEYESARDRKPGARMSAAEAIAAFDQVA
ncbi:MAG TPA: hypothetical protein VGN08_13585 [Solirubrobacteraceae bacterium]